MDEDLKFPETVNDLMSLLQRTFPAKQPLLADTHTKIMYEAGQRSVVEWLIQLQKEPED